MRLLKLANFHRHKPSVVASLLGVIWLVFALLEFSNSWENWKNKEFDYLSVLTAPGKSTLPITLVGIDEASFADLGLQWPWPRSLHARLIDRLSKAGAAVIAFDVIFAESSNPREDQQLAEAIKRAGTVVLAAGQVYEESAYANQWIRVDPLPLLRKNGGLAGLADLAMDGDMVIRRMPDSQDAFWRQVIAAFYKARPGLLPQRPAKPQAMIRYLGPSHTTFPYVSYHQVVKGDKALPADFFQDQIVLVGRDVRASPDAGAAQADTFATPLLGQNNRLMPGVEIQATLIENVLNQQTIAKADYKFALLLLTLVMVLAGIGVTRWHPLYSGIYLLLLLAMLAGLGGWLFGQRNYWLPVAPAMSAVVAVYLCTAMLSYFFEQRRGREIKSAFARYVSAEVVEEMIAHPERLKLGGERRELTVLFADMAGFTAISEKLPPEVVAKLVNAYLTEMARVVMAYGGTVDKFIGDAVMAFWGAPLPDDLQALHACQAARDMQTAMAGLSPLYAQHGVYAVSIRIGVHSGVATVGNMGSEARFDYTALGDTVNLASRLEGVNKLYGTHILLSADTAAGMDKPLALRLVDKVRVKGKQQPVEIFTLCDNAELNRLTLRAIAEYRQRHWQASLALWTEIGAEYPTDGVAQVYFKRIREFQEQNPPGDWDGSVALDKL
ncbi:MAG: adenylate/guanylate cyclase domain-containing protein [Methylococcaceae bacterium]|nr:MAG: adenylate/guanylate cyclase domain-containing protein [Methylococcaceae bacterium]